MAHVVYLSLGTNIGDRENNLTIALEEIEDFTEIKKMSRVYDTPPWGYQNQNRFLNMVIQITSNLDPEDLLKILKEIESQLGRKPSFRYGPRLIDIDILYYDRLILEKEGLTIPHPRLHERDFVLFPLCEIARDLQHPILNKRSKDLLSELKIGDIFLFQSRNIPTDFLKELVVNQPALECFLGLPVSHQHKIITWIEESPELETRETRIQKSISRLCYPYRFEVL